MLKGRRKKMFDSIKLTFVNRRVIKLMLIKLKLRRINQKDKNKKPINRTLITEENCN